MIRGHRYYIFYSMQLFGLTTLLVACTDRVSLAENAVVSDWANTLASTGTVDTDTPAPTEATGQEEVPTTGNGTEVTDDGGIEETIEDLAALQLEEDEEFLENFVF